MCVCLYVLCVSGVGCFACVLCVPLICSEYGHLPSILLLSLPCLVTLLEIISRDSFQYYYQIFLNVFTRFGLRSLKLLVSLNINSHIDKNQASTWMILHWLAFRGAKFSLPEMLCGNVNFLRNRFDFYWYMCHDDDDVPSHTLKNLKAEYLSWKKKLIIISR
jgi:hypothetical protein